ncbi:MAG: helix-turn-helix domain-containing protein [Bacteroidota bacterium]|nr:helix-turn-helix domain-containing protein [Bacteroidota bacterium]
MSKIKLADEFNPKCPIRNILSRISDKWSILVLYTLQENEVIRFKELQRCIPDISQKMLTVTLRTLEEDGLVNRKVYAEIPPKVEYTLTDRAKSLLPHINTLIAWANENLEAIMNNRKKASKQY